MFAVYMSVEMGGYCQVTTEKGHQIVASRSEENGKSQTERGQ